MRRGCNRRINSQLWQRKTQAARQAAGAELVRTETTAAGSTARPRGCGDLEEILRVVDLLGVEETVQLPNARRMAHLAQRLCLDLADALARHLELLADFLECAAVAVDKAEPQRKDPALALGERIQNIDDLFAEQRVRGHVVR